jgi:hypothetical protein
MKQAGLKAYGQGLKGAVSHCLHSCLQANRRFSVFSE